MFNPHVSVAKFLCLDIHCLVFDFIVYTIHMCVWLQSMFVLLKSECLLVLTHTLSWFPPFFLLEVGTAWVKLGYPNN